MLSRVVSFRASSAVRSPSLAVKGNALRLRQEGETLRKVILVEIAQAIQELRHVRGVANDGDDF